MIKISHYQTLNEKLVKTFCSLAEKCYQSEQNTVVITNDDKIIDELDKTLWTYSRKNFIPHGIISDPMLEKQPIFITHELSNPNNAKILFFFNVSKESLILKLSKHNVTKLNNFDRIIFLSETLYETEITDILQALEKYGLKDIKFESFTQEPNGNWRKLNS